MDNNASPYDAGATLHNYKPRQFRIQAGVTRGIRHQLRHISSMMVRLIGMAMRLSCRVEMPASASRIRGTAIPFFMNMEAMGSGGQTG